MLVLTRKSKQSIMIGDEIEISVLGVSGQKVRLGIQAPRSVQVFRKEVYVSVQNQSPGVGSSSQNSEVEETLERLEAHE